MVEGNLGLLGALEKVADVGVLYPLGDCCWL